MGSQISVQEHNLDKSEAFAHKKQASVISDHHLARNSITELKSIGSRRGTIAFQTIGSRRGTIIKECLKLPNIENMNIEADVA